jgi:hypothetical protein
MSTTRKDSPTISRSTSRRCAPSAIRIPISIGAKRCAVRCERADATEYPFSYEAVGQTVQMESDHSLRFSSLPAGDYTLSVRTVNEGVEKELGFASVRVVDANVYADIDLGNATEVRGSVEGQGLSVTGKHITLETFEWGLYLLHQAPGIDPGGRFAITNLPPGEFIFTVSDTQRQESAYVKKAICSGQDYASRECTLAVGSALDCDITLASDLYLFRSANNGEGKEEMLLLSVIPLALIRRTHTARI